MYRNARLPLMFALSLLGLAAGCSSGAQVAAKPQVAGVPDVDHDGIPDDVDECVTEKEDGKQPKPEDGCKADPTDEDGDGLGLSDKCPTKPETVNGFEDDDGCPDELPKETKAVVTVTKDELKCCAKILFATGKATIEEASAPLIDHVAKTLQDNPAIDLLEVSGHADRLGSPERNLSLTRQRADAVVEALAKLGIDRKRLQAAGYGSYCPMVAGDTPEARERNRRVEFKIIRSNGTDTGVELGCAAARAKGIGSGASGAHRSAPPKSSSPAGST
jgi:outer membrane protein OmpA-like peptidoglycan-associated protein